MHYIKKTDSQGQQTDQEDDDMEQDHEDNVDKGVYGFLNFGKNKFIL
jgi:hypothetical protein